MITDTSSAIVLENSFAKIELSKNDASPVIKYKSTGKDIALKNKPFFALYDKEGNAYKTSSISLSSGLITISTELGKVIIEAEEKENYFTFELKEKLPPEAYYLALCDVEYDYDENELGAVGLPITFWVNPMCPPDLTLKKTVGRVFPHLRDEGAKYALLIAPKSAHRDILKEICLTIDKETGIVSKIGGPFTNDSRIAFGNYIIEYSSNSNTLKERLSFYKEIGVDQIDYHHNFDEKHGTFRTGDFRFAEYVTASEFKKNVADVLGRVLFLPV